MSSVLQLVSKFKILPKTLYRIQVKLPVIIKDYDTQLAKKGHTTGYNLKLHNGLVMPAEGDEWIGPNGMPVRPANDVMLKVVNNWKGEPPIFRLNDGLRLPENLIVLHEPDDLWSIQTTVPVSLKDFNATLTELLERATKVTRQQFLEEMKDLDDQDN